MFVFKGLAQNGDPVDSTWFLLTHSEQLGDGGREQRRNEQTAAGMPQKVSGATRRRTPFSKAVWGKNNTKTQKPWMVWDETVGGNQCITAAMYIQNELGKNSTSTPITAFINHL